MPESFEQYRVKDDFEQYKVAPVDEFEKYKIKVEPPKFIEPSQTPAWIRAIPATALELAKTLVPGGEYLEKEKREEFLKEPWLPPEWGKPKAISEWLQPTPSKVGAISKGLAEVGEWVLFPKAITGVGQLIKPFLPQKFISFITKERHLLKPKAIERPPVAIEPEAPRPAEVAPEVKPPVAEVAKPIGIKPTPQEEAVVDRLIAEKKALPFEREKLIKQLTEPREGEKLLMEPTVKFEPHKEMAEAGTESMVAKGIKRDPKKLMTEQLIDEWLANPSKYEEIASKYGVKTKEFASIMREQASSWGKKLGELGLEAQRLGKEIPELGEALEELAKIAKPIGPFDWLSNVYRRATMTWKGMLVTQLSTAMRNAETQAGRVGLDVLEQGLNSGLQKTLGKPQTVHPLDGFENLLRLFQKNKTIVNKILEAHPRQYNRLYGTYLSDIESSKAGGEIGQGIAKVVDVLNTANRFQEFTIRRATFMGELDRLLRNKGMDLTGIIERNELGSITDDVLKKSIDKALNITFAEQPKWGTLGQKFVSFVNAMPGASFIMPFPRFLVNSLKFNFEYSPFGVLKYLSPTERKAFSTGNMEVMSKAILGSSMFLTAYQIRNSKYAGEKWNEMDFPKEIPLIGGKTADTRAFNPFASYLFVADVIKKWKDGTLHKLTTKDITMGILSSNLRAGTGLYALDKILDGLLGTGSSEKAINYIKQFLGEIAGGFLTPLNQIKEIASGFDDYVVKEKRSEPFWGPIKEKIPGLEKELPAYYTGTRKDPLTRETPIVRQMTGFMLKTKNIFEKELDKLGFEPREILPSTGNPEADNLIKKYMGIYAEKTIIPFLQSDGYKRIKDDRQKAYIITDLLKKSREASKIAAQKVNPKIFGEIAIEKIPRRTKEALKSIGMDVEKIGKKENFEKYRVNP
jgi:hypothetical protein